MNIKRILNILNPRPAIGGLEINDSDLRFILIEGNKLVSASISLPAGVIEEGRIKDKNSFKTALVNLHSQITPSKKKKIYAVVNIPDVNIYSQIFNLPFVASVNLEEAAYLNLQMISPMDFSTVYADWQKVGEVEIDGGQLEILSAFIQRQIIDEFAECLKEANFVVVALEFFGLAISRLISGLRGLTNLSLLLRINSSGLSFNLIKNYNLYFSHFVAWPVGENRQISFSVLKDLIVRETQKVFNFSNTNWPGQLNNFLLVTSALEDKISQIIQENFSFAFQKLTLTPKLVSPKREWSITNNQLSSLSSDWFGALGSALRGLIPRSKDIIISLASTGTEEEFHQHQLISFVKIWRNIILTSLSFIIIAFVASEIFLIQNNKSLNSQLANLTNKPEAQEISKLQEEAQKFNQLIEVALRAKTQTSNWLPLFEKIEKLAGKDITIERIFIQSATTPILLNGRATNEAVLINFKNDLEKDSQFQDINMPLSINPLPSGLISFNITFGLK